jgi:(1->4)-alpha-D-glucan 1-alpha-D-glucosylmutase
LKVEGPQADHVLAFARAAGERLVIVAVGRLLVPLLGEATAPLVADAAWHGTNLVLPRLESHHNYVNTLGGPLPAVRGSRIPVADLFGSLPVALLEGR